MLRIVRKIKVKWRHCFVDDQDVSKRPEFIKKCMQCWWLEADFKNRMCFLLFFLLCEQRLDVQGEGSDHVLLMTEHVVNRKDMFLVDIGNEKWASPQIRLVLKTTWRPKKVLTFFCPPCLLDLLTWLFFFLVFLFISSQIHCTKGKQDAKLQSKKARHKEYEDKL